MNEEDILQGFKDGKITANEVLGFYRELKAKVSANANADEYPLSEGQLGLWLIDSVNPGANVYNVPFCIRFQGPLFLQTLKRACEYVLKRHPILSNVFIEKEGGKTLQKHQTSHGVNFIHRDLSGQTDSQIHKELVKHAKQPFNLSEGPLYRFVSCSLSEGEHYILIVVHHIIFDGSSIPIVMNDLFEFYEGLNQGEQLQLIDDATPYKYFVERQQLYLASEKATRDKDYWNSKLNGKLPLLKLFLENSEPPSSDSNELAHGKTCRFSLSSSKSKEAKSLCRELGINASVFFLTLFKLLLNRHSDETDIIVGMPSMGRRNSAFHTSVGYFVNMLALRTSIQPDKSFRVLLNDVENTLIDAMDHEDYPFPRLVEDLKVRYKAGVSPVFQVAFVYQNNSMNLPAKASADAKTINNFEIVDAIHQEGEFKLQLEIIEFRENFLFNMKYDENRFDEGSVEVMLNHYIQLMNSAIVNATASIDSYSLVSPAENRRVLEDWNNTVIAQEVNVSESCDYLHQYFEKEVSKNPSAIAAIFEDQALSYQELNQRANQLAYFLREERGVGPEKLVGVCLTRSLDMLISILAILKAGGAYVPLDPHYPKKRIAYMLDDASLGTVITCQDIVDKALIDKRRALCLDSPETQSKLRLKKNSNIDFKSAGLRSSNLAYVIYTSGSTGNPKGVMIQHSSASAFISWATSAFNEKQLSCVLASTSMCFDLSIFEMFAPLAAGGTVVLVENALSLNGGLFIKEGQKKPLSLINTVPSAIESIIANNALPESVKTVNLAGEPLKQRTVDALYRLGVEQVFDLYGPSEDTTYSTYTLREFKGKANIGRAISNTQVYVLDQHKNSLPVGIAGELYIGGAGLSRGYLNRPELTKEKFVDNPFYESRRGGLTNSELTFVNSSIDLSTVSEKLYRTGDLVRWLPEGKLEYLGRIDHQVKIRGFRIELGEIEQTLHKHSAINDAVVVAKEFSGNDASINSDAIESNDIKGNPDIRHIEKELVAYCVAEGETSAATLRQHLSQTLPDYMVPSHYVFLDKLPLTPNGKVDRKALPEPKVEVSEETYVAPKTADEKALAEIWQEVLGVEQVGVRDNFFEIGGNSMAAIKLSQLTQARHGQNLDFRFVFQNPTIESLLEARDSQQQVESQSNDLFVFRQGKESADTVHRPLFLTHSILANTVHYTEFCRSLIDIVPEGAPIYGLNLLETDTCDEVFDSIENLASFHISVMRRAQSNGPYRILGYSFGGALAYEMARQLRDEGEDIEFLALLDAGKPTPDDEKIDVLLRNRDEVFHAQDYLFTSIRAFNPDVDETILQDFKPGEDKDVEDLLFLAQDQGYMPDEFTYDHLMERARVRLSLLTIISRYEAVSIDVPTHLITSEEAIKVKGEYLGWNSLLVDNWKVRNIQGSEHLKIMHPPHVAEVAQTIADWIDLAKFGISTKTHNRDEALLVS